jgi:hypothetical protein
MPALHSGTPVLPEKKDVETKTEPIKHYAHNNPMSSYTGAVAIYSAKMKPNLKQRPVSASTIRSGWFPLHTSLTPSLTLNVIFCMC